MSCISTSTEVKDLNTPPLLCCDVSSLCLTWQDEEDDDEGLRRSTAVRRDGVHPVCVCVCVCVFIVQLDDDNTVWLCDGAAWGGSVGGARHTVCFCVCLCGFVCAWSFGDEVFIDSVSHILNVCFCSHAALLIFISDSSPLKWGNVILTFQGFKEYIKMPPVHFHTMKNLHSIQSLQSVFSQSSVVGSLSCAELSCLRPSESKSNAFCTLCSAQVKNNRCVFWAAHQHGQQLQLMELIKELKYTLCGWGNYSYLFWSFLQYQSGPVTAVCASMMLILTWLHVTNRE